MAIAVRLRKLEQRMGLHGPCPVCNDVGAVVIVHGDEEPVGGCSACGKQFVVRYVAWDAEKEDVEERRVRDAHA